MRIDLAKERSGEKGKKVDKATLAEHDLAQMPESPQSPPNVPRVIEVLAFPQVQLLDVAGPLQVFASANDHVVKCGGTPPYLLQVVAQGGFGVLASAGLGLAAGRLPATEAALGTPM